MCKFENLARKRCKEIDCLPCHNKSFSSVSNSQYMTINNDDITARDLSKYSDRILEFKCHKCTHNFNMKVHRVSVGNWCQYCVSKLLCNDNACAICFDKSFASHERSMYWDDEKNDKTPRQVTKLCNNKFNFNCENCNHSFTTALNIIVSGSWCPYCANKILCNDKECIICFEKSFASHPRSKYLDTKKNNKTARQSFKNSHEKNSFICSECNHKFNMGLENINKRDQWCPYCSYKLCNETDCNSCFNKSFASVDSTDKWRWSSKNTLIQRDYRKFSNCKGYFECIKCDKEFINYLYNITNGVGCPFCKNKTETKLLKYLEQNFKQVKSQVKFEWSKMYGRYSRTFDFYLEDYNIIIELDGLQHFQDTYFGKVEKFAKIDEEKNEMVRKQGINMIRIGQQMVWDDAEDWKIKLSDTINNIAQEEKIGTITKIGSIYTENL